MASLTLNLTLKQAKQLHRVLAASAEACAAGIHPRMPKRKGGEESETKAEKRHHRANRAVFDLLRAAHEQAQAAMEEQETQAEQELPDPLRLIVASLQEKGIDVKVKRVDIQSQPEESE